MSELAVKVYHWQNGMVMSFDAAGQQIGELQPPRQLSSAEFDQWLAENQKAGLISRSAQVERGAVWR